MGGGASNDFYATEDIPGHDARAIQFYRETLQLSEAEVQRLYGIFCDADVDKSGYLREDELRQYLRIEQSDFYDFLFKMYRKGSRGYINFFEFVCSVRILLFLNVYQNLIFVEMCCRCGIFWQQNNEIFPNLLFTCSAK